MIPRGSLGESVFVTGEQPCPEPTSQGPIEALPCIAPALTGKEISPAPQPGAMNRLSRKSSPRDAPPTFILGLLKDLSEVQGR